MLYSIPRLQKRGSPFRIFLFFLFFRAFRDSDKSKMSGIGVPSYRRGVALLRIFLPFLFFCDFRDSDKEKRGATGRSRLQKRYAMLGFVSQPNRAIRGNYPFKYLFDITTFLQFMRLIVKVRMRNNPQI